MIAIRFGNDWYIVTENNRSVHTSNMQSHRCLDHQIKIYCSLNTLFISSFFLLFTTSLNTCLRDIQKTKNKFLFGLAAVPEEMNVFVR